MALKKPKNIPKTPGVYIFRTINGRPLYVGKAGNLRTRLAFYFRGEARTQPRLRKLLAEARRLTLLKVNSEIEALVTEARLIKAYRPKYNILMRDDKNYLFVVIRKERFAKIFLTHQPNAFPRSAKIIGPFTDVASVKTTLKLLRRIFPYCTCTSPHKGLCLNAEIGKCPGPCCSKGLNHAERRRLPEIEKDYRANVKSIVSILEGKKIAKLRNALKKELRKASSDLHYERAARLRDQLFGLQEILRHRAVIKGDEPQESAWPRLEEKIERLLGARHPLTRIEGYDISNISGTASTGSMVVFTNGVPDKNEYRKFRIKTVAGANDVAMISEVISRRMRHSEWKRPDLIVLDGGKPQLFAVRKKLVSGRVKIRTHITALAKRDEELYIAGKNNPLQLKRQPRDVLHFFQRVRDEAHRFAKKYHQKLREKELKNG